MGEIAKWAKRAADEETKWPADKLKKAKKLAGKLAEHEEVENPHALARFVVAQKKAAGGKCK
jgi:biotin-(acetyl-CoA carboxylase) ligase